MNGTLPKSQSYYALENLQIQKKAIGAASDFMISCRKAVEKHLTTDKSKAKDSYDALNQTHSKLVNVIGSASLFLHEIGDEQLAAYGAALAEKLRTFNLMTKDYSALEKVLLDYTDRLPEPETTDATVIGRLMNSVKMGHYPTDLENVELIMRGISFPDGITTNLLDPCCGDGSALKKLAVGNNCYTYGFELDESRAEKAQDTLHRVGFGSYFHGRVSREAFHALFLNPPYLSVITEGGSRSRDEKRFLLDSIPRLMQGGLLIYIIPYYRLTPDICRVLCDNFEDISVHRFTTEEFKKFRQVVIMGTRIKRIDGSEQAEWLAEFSLKPDELPCVTDLETGRYPLPAIARKVDIFKGAEFNVRELQRQLKQSKSFDDIMSTKRLDTSIRRPPLPFSFSQLGLIGGSGLINGLIDCDEPHIIKGRIVKEVKIDRDNQHNRKGELVSTKVTETASNKMIFNILTPEGFKSLA